MRNWLILNFLLIKCVTIYAQGGHFIDDNDSIYARKLLDTLTSKSFYGRGYTHEGMKKAGIYIKKAFKKIKLRPIVKKEFQQPFNYSVNIFPNNVALTVNNKKLIPGKDFLVSNESRSIDIASALEKTDSVTYIDKNHHVIISLVDKLTWSVSQKQEDYTAFNVLKSSLAEPCDTYQADVESELIPSFEAFNIAGIVKGKEVPDSFLVFTAHYDHLGTMGDDIIFPGANDNASGVALLLTLAKYYAKHPLKYSILFIAFAGEEAGLVGSQYFTDHPPIELNKIRFLTNLDLMGNGEEGITVVNATEFPKEFKLIQEINNGNNYLAAVNSRGKAKNSDHYWFTEKGVPSFFIYTLGQRKSYHDINDVSSTLPLNKINDLKLLLTNFYETLIK